MTGADEYWRDSSLRNFYTSADWRAFRLTEIQKRTNAMGDVISDLSGRPIVNPRDIVLHHKVELTPKNVEDASIALNPDNIMVISASEHNDIHKRFGAKGKAVHIVYGCYGSGKTTYVNKLAMTGDLIVDVDALFSAVSILPYGMHDGRLMSSVMALRQTLYDVIKTRRGDWSTAWVIGGYPLRAERERLARDLDADLILIDRTFTECIQHRDRRIVEDWFRKAGREREII